MWTHFFPPAASPPRKRERGFTHPIRHLPLFVPEPPVVGEAPPEARPYFLFAGRLERLKGVQTLLEVFAKYDSAELVIAGDGDYAGELKRQASGLEHVRFVGRRDTAGLGSLYAHAIALIVPTVGFEVFPFVTLEAFAHRTPAIVRDRGGLPEAIVDSGAGFTYRTDDELVAAMEALRRDNLLRDELGRRGYERIGGSGRRSRSPGILKIVEELLLAETAACCAFTLARLARRSQPIGTQLRLPATPPVPDGRWTGVRDRWQTPRSPAP